MPRFGGIVNFHRKHSKSRLSHVVLEGLIFKLLGSLTCHFPFIWSFVAPTIFFFLFFLLFPSSLFFPFILHFCYRSFHFHSFWFTCPHFKFTCFCIDFKMEIPSSESNLMIGNPQWDMDSISDGKVSSRGNTRTSCVISQAASITHFTYIQSLRQWKNTINLNNTDYFI